AGGPVCEPVAADLRSDGARHPGANGPGGTVAPGPPPRHAGRDVPRPGPGLLPAPGAGAHTDPRQVARDILKQSSHLIPGRRDGWYRDVLKFNAGQMEVADLEPKAGAARFNQCEAFYYIGLRKLAERQRTEAKEWFTRSYETGVFPYGEYMWSRAFLACIDDPDWLP